MNRKERRNMKKICNAKDLVCKTCVTQLTDNCDKCPIANLVDNELRRMNGAKKQVKSNEFTEIVDSLVFK